MAHKVNNSKGFLVAEVSLTECVEKLGGYGICDSCNGTSEKGYYVAALNHWVCPKCYNEWMQRAKNYEEDKPIEKRNFDYYSKILGI